MKRIYNLKRLLALCLMVVLGLWTSCDSDDESSSKIVLNSFGPSPALRGGELRFIGQNLDKVTAIVLPENVEVTNFKLKTASSIVIDIPKATAVEGKVILKTPQGDIESKSLLGISEPITITSLSPAALRPGDELTISGTYLNLVQEVIFAKNKSVTTFESQSETTIKLVVPDDAETGIVIVSNGLEDPILVKSESPLTVITPAVTSLSPGTIKAGAILTIEGANLDLVKDVIFPGVVSRVTTFQSQTATKIEVVVPNNSQDGNIIVRPASLVEIESPTAITMIIPTITGISPAPAKNSQNITVTGANLDLVTSVVFGGDKTGDIQAGGTPTSITVKVPADAINGVVKFNTASNKSVASADILTLVLPTITSITPTTVNTKDEPSITINGTHLDLVTDVIFGGDWTTKASGSATQITVKVVPGSVTDKVAVVTTNGSNVASGQTLTIVPDVPNITSLPTEAFLGSIISLTGTNMNVPSDIILPGNIKATMFGTKSSTLIELFIPMNIPQGKGKIKFVTAKNEIYESPEISFKLAGVEPVQDQALVFFNFNGKNSWWGAVSVVNDASSVDGTSYGRINGSYNGWTDLFWRNSKNDFPADVIGTNVADYVIKFDINILAPITGGNLKMRLEGSAGDYWWALGPAAPGGDGSPVGATPNWTTITVPISAFKDNFGWGSNSPTDLSTITGAFGMAFDNGSSTVNIMVDNVRFHKIN